MEKRKVFFESRGKRLGGYLYIPDGKGPFPVVVLVHGFTGGTHEIKNRHMCDALADNGFVALMFDFYDKPNGLSEPKIEDTNVTNQMEDVKAAIDFMEKQNFINKKRIGLTGHSLGGMTIILYAALHDARVKALVIQSPVSEISDTDAATAFLASSAKKKGYVKLSKDWGSFNIKYTFWEDATKHDIYGQAERISVPTLLFHGEKDEVVPLKQSKELFKHLKMKEKKFEIIKGADHSYYEYGTLAEATKLMIGWFKKYL